MATCDRTILVLDHDALGNDGRYQRLLEQETTPAYRVLTEGYSGPILDLCRTYSVAGILLVCHASDLRGVDLLAQLRAELGKACPPIVVVGDNDASLTRRAFKAGAADYLIQDQVTADTLYQALSAAIPASGTAASDPTAALSSDDRYRDLVESIDEGFCICEMLLNQEGAPIDFRFLEINSMFESLTGLQQPVGKTASELVPDLEEVWFETYGRVALDRQPIRFEQQSVPMQRWFDVYAFPMGKPQHHLFGILFRNITIRKLAEQEQEKFFAVGSDLQVVTSGDGYLRWVSPSFERLLGWTVAETTARPWTEFIHPDDVSLTMLETESLFSSQEIVAFENRYRDKDGSYHWLLWRAQPDSTQQLLYGAAVDITESKRHAANTAFLAEIATEFSRLSSAEQIMQTVGAKIGAHLNLFAFAFAEIDAAEAEATINYAWHAERTLDPEGTYHIADFVTDDFRQAAHNRETIVVRDTYADARTNGDQYAALNISSFVSVPFHKDGRWQFMLNVYDSVPHDWRDDEVELIRELAHQIFPRLERARAEAALKESEARFKGFAENSNDVIWITDASKHQLVYVSPSFEQVWGRSATELYANLQCFIDFIHPDDRDRVQQGWHQCTQAAFTQEYRIIRPDGTIIWIRDRGFPIFDHQGALLWIGGIAEDISDRKQVEERLQQRETELSLVTNAVPSLISFIDSEQCYRFNNHTYANWFGQPVAETYGKHLRDVLGAAAYKIIRPYVEQVLAGQQVTFESEVPYKNGGTRYINATYVPRFNEQGAVEGFVALISDISGRKQTEIALRESEERLTLATQAANLGVFEWKVQADCAIWENAQMYDIFGHTLADGTLSNAQFMGDVIHPNDREAFARCLAEGIKNERFQATCRIRRRSDGEWRWVEFIGQFELASDGASLRLVGVLSDISDRKRDEAKRRQAEAELRRSAEQLNLALAAAKLGNWNWDIASDMVTFSAQAAEIFGIPPGPHMTWTQMRNLIHPDDRDRARLQVEQAIADHSGYDIEYQVVRADGQSRWVAAKGRAQYDLSTQVVGMIGVVQDITSCKQTEQEREQLLTSERTARAQAEAANRIKDEFLTVVSHELRSPLNPILGWSQLLRKGQLDAQKTQYALDVIERNAQVQAQLINDLLDVSRILRGKLSLNKKAVDLAVVVRAALETVQLAADAKSIQIHTTLEPNLGTVWGDIDRLQQVAWNLLSNAVKFTPEGKQIEVRLEQVEGKAPTGHAAEPIGVLEVEPGDRPPSDPLPTYIQLTVSDTGKGIHPDFLPHVFDRFRQENATTTRQFGGLGLGLALVRYLVELHGGRVQADSPGEGQGATFTVQIPLMAQKAAIDQAVERSKPSTDLTNVQILVVDDDATTLEFIAFLLELNGARVVAAASVDEALSELAQFRPDILLSDIGMPERDGYMLMRQVRRLSPEQGGQVPAIALTAYAGEIDYQQAMAAGFQKHISKPVEPDYLVAAIADLLKRNDQ